MKKILFAVQLPPPIHGASMVNKTIVNSTRVQKHFVTKTLPLKFADSVAGIGKVSIGKLLRIPGFVCKLVGIMLSYKPNIVFYNFSPDGISFYRDAVFVAIIKLFRPTIVLHLQGQGVAANLNTGWKKWLYSRTFRNTYPLCLANILYNDITEIHTGKYGVLNCGVPVVQGLKEFENDVPEIIFISNFYKAKGIWLFVEILEVLTSRKVPFKCVLIGNDGDVSVEEVRSCVSEKGIPNTSVLGPVYGEEKFLMMNKADVFIFPTMREAFPLTILEAMQCGTVPIASNVGGIPEIIDNDINGFICDSRNVDDWVDIVVKLFGDRGKLRLLQQNAREKFKEKYTQETFESNLLQVLRNLN